MPNHVTHRMTVTGEPQDIEAFTKQVLTLDEEGHQQFDCNAVVPQPAILSRTVSPPRFGENGRHMLRDLTAENDTFGLKTIEATPEEQVELDALPHKDWYSWCLANWGTKWGAYSFQMQKETPTEIEFTFDTAWSPPSPVLHKIAEQYPQLDFAVSAFDEGWGFAYRAIANDGILFENELAATDEEYENVHGYLPERWEDEEDAA